MCTFGLSGCRVKPRRVQTLASPFGRPTLAKPTLANFNVLVFWPNFLNPLRGPTLPDLSGVNSSVFYFLFEEGQNTETLKLAKIDLAKVDTQILAKVGLAIGQSRSNKDGQSRSQAFTITNVVGALGNQHQTSPVANITTLW